MRTCALCVALIVCGTAAAQPPGGRGGPGGGRRPDPAALVAKLMAYDADKDGKLTKKELTDPRLQRLFEAADADKDGSLTAAELTAYFTREAAAGGERGGPGGRGPGGPGGPGGFPGGGPPGGPGGFAPPRPGEILPPFLLEMLDLDLTADQQKKLAALQKEVDAKLDAILTPAQRKKLKEFSPGGPGGPPGGFPGGPPPGGPGGPPPDRPAPADEAPAGPPVAAVKAAVEKALPVLWAGADGHSDKRSCFTCHHHGVPLLAFTTARDHGFAVPADRLSGLVEFVAADIEAQRERLLSGQGPGPPPSGGGADNTGYMLLALAAAGRGPDADTDALVQYTLGFRLGRDHWHSPSPRPPTEASSFTTTALAIRGLRRYAGPAHRERAERRIDQAKGWLQATAPKDTEDRVFRLVGLHAAGAAAADIRAAADDLAITQRADGGWGQTDQLDSDAYATATALYALHTAGGRPADAPEYRKGLAFLLDRQKSDGSWHVKTRSRKVQTYFETGFPHGEDQFISCAATGWATAALALAVPAR